MVDCLLCCCAAGSGSSGQGDNTDDVARLHADLQMKDQELHGKNQLINQLVRPETFLCFQSWAGEKVGIVGIVVF